jgi:hypothetical protein
MPFSGIFLIPPHKRLIERLPDGQRFDRQGLANQTKIIIRLEEQSPVWLPVVFRAFHLKAGAGLIRQGQASSNHRVGLRSRLI